MNIQGRRTKRESEHSLIFSARFRITWPYWAGPYPDQNKALELIETHQSDLRTAVEKKLSEVLGGDLLLSDISFSPFQPSGVEISFPVKGPSHREIDLDELNGVVYELKDLVTSFIEDHMPQARQGANAYEVEGEFWTPRGWLQKVKSPKSARQTRNEGLDASDFEHSTATISRSEPLTRTAMTDQELEQLLTALARKHLKPRLLASVAPALRDNVERLLSTRRFLRVVADRPENPGVYQALGTEIETAPAQPVVDSLRDLGILDALDDAPRQLFANLRRTAIPNEDLSILLRGGVEDPEAELTLLLYFVRELAISGEAPSKIFEEAVRALKNEGEQLKTNQVDVAPRNKRKMFNGIGNLLMGLATAGGNALLLAGTVVAPNPATGYAAIGSAAVAVGAVFKGLGDLRGE
jgi:hypothetical protein